MNYQVLLKRTSAWVGALLLAVVLASPAAAQHGDFLLSIQNGNPNKIDVGLVDFGVSVLELSGHVAHEIEVPVFPSLNLPGEATLEPGFVGEPVPGGLNISPNAALPSNTAVSFSFRTFYNPDLALSGNLFYWNYVANPSGPLWEVNPAGHTLAWAHNPGAFPLTGSASVDGANVDVPGFVIDTTDANGGLHRHLDTILAGAGNTDPSIGIYLAAVRFEMNPMSDPVFLLVGALDLDNPIDEEEFEGYLHEAEEWVEDNYALLTNGPNAVPEPSSILLGAAGGLGLIGLAIRRRRSRRAEM